MTEYQMTITDQVDATVLANYNPTLEERILNLSKENQNLARDLETQKDSIEILQNTVASFRRQIMEKDSYISSAKALIVEAYECDDFEKDRVEAIAEALGIALTKQYAVSVNVTFSGTVTAPLGMDLEDLNGYLEASIDTNGYNDDFDVDLSEDDIEVTVIY